MAPIPEDSYGIAKLAVEQELEVTREMFGLDYIIFRPQNVNGERQDIGDRYRNVVGIFMNQILRDEPMTNFGDGTQVRAFTHIDDVTPIVASSVDVPGARDEVLNVRADVPYAVNDLARIVSEAMEAECRVVHLDPRNEVRLHSPITAKPNESSERKPKRRCRRVYGNGGMGEGAWCAREQYIREHRGSE
jgi:UDP-glucose 4-epimerase